MCYLPKECSAKSPMAIEFHVAGDGLEALRYLRREGPYQDSPQPDVILLDLNMPRMDGRKIVSRAKRKMSN